MSLQAIHDSVDDIPEPYRDLYTERDGKFELTGIAGVKTQADVDRLNEGLRKERNDHKLTKEALSPWADLNPEEVHAQLDRIPELEAAATGKIDDEKLNEMVETRLKSRVGPVERENVKLKTELEEATGMIAQMRQKETTRLIHDNVRGEAMKMKVIDTAVDDVLMYAERVLEVREDDGAIVTRDGVGVTPGIPASEWLAEMQQSRPHWWPPSQGSGAGGSGQGGGYGKNPWTADNWDLTAQGQIFREKGADYAQRMASAAGSHIGATKPAPKR